MFLMKILCKVLLLTLFMKQNIIFKHNLTFRLHCSEFKPFDRLEKRAVIVALKGKTG